MVQVYLPENADQDQPLVFHYQKGTLYRIVCTFVINLGWYSFEWFVG